LSRSLAGRVLALTVMLALLQTDSARGPGYAAVRALTIGAARIAGASERVGSIERGKIANVIVTDGDLFEEKTRIRHVFVDGREVILEAPRPQPRKDGASGG
jgi:imidazolonepropionase-like amidohydrolase